MTRPDLAALRAECLALLRDWVPIRSVVGDAAGLLRMAGAVASYLRDGLGATIVPAGGACTPPLVHARLDRGAARTIMVYNMYDVMPAAAAGWVVDPFTGGIADLPRHGPCFVARGAENNKGPLAGMLVALGWLLRTGNLDVNIEILVEGQEESGSRELRRYLADPASPIRPCGVTLFPSFCEYGGGPPRIYLGSKGIAHGRIVVQGQPDTPARPAHSSNAPWIANPAWRLAQALAAVTPDATGRLGQGSMPADALPILDALAAGFDQAAELRFRHTAAFALSGDAQARLRAVLTGTALNLASISTDPAEARGVIPSSASARFDLRVPPDVPPGPVLDQVAARLAPMGARLLVDDTMPGHRFPLSAPGVAALQATYRRAGITPQIWPWAIGAAPAHAFAARAGAFLIGGLGHGGDAHGVNEFVTLAGLDRYIGSLIDWLPATAAELAGRADALPVPV